MNRKLKKNYLVISGPSGGGKSTVCNLLLKLSSVFVLSVSHTTRKPRPEETEGSSYFFVTEEEFEGLIQKGQFIEWARYRDNYYGTSRAFLESQKQAGKIVLLDIDIQGVKTLQRDFAEDTLSIFLDPPSFAELEARLRHRATENDADIDARLEIAKAEIAEADIYDYRVVNENIEATVEAVVRIVEKEIGQFERR